MPRWSRQRALVVVSRAGACAFALALPGPCTSFDGLAVPVDADADAQDAAPADGAPAAPCSEGVHFIFATDAGCTEVADENCCVFETECARSDACATWVECINACPPPRGSSCINKCGPTPREGGAGNALTGLGNCRDAIDGGARCVWP